MGATPTDAARAGQTGEQYIQLGQSLLGYRLEKSGPPLTRQHSAGVSHKLG